MDSMAVIFLKPLLILLLVRYVKCFWRSFEQYCCVYFMLRLFSYAVLTDHTLIHASLDTTLLHSNFNAWILESKFITPLDSAQKQGSYKLQDKRMHHCISPSVKFTIYCELGANCTRQ